MTSASDHAGRLGASRAAAVLGRDYSVNERGVIRWRCTPAQAWLEIMGRPVERDPELEEPARWGTVLEDAVARHGYEHATGHKLARVNRTLRHRDHPWLTCHLDRRVLVVRPTIPYQGKCRSAFLRQYWGEQGTDQIPRPELIQVCAEMAIAGSALRGGVECERVGVLFGGNEFAWFHVERNLDLERELLAELAEWWQRHIVEGKEPEPMSEADCRALWRRCHATSREATDADLAIVRECVEAKAAADAALERQRVARLAARKALGRHEEIVHEVRRNGGPPKLRPLIRWPQVWEVDEAKLLAENADAAEKHRTILDVDRLATEDPALHAELLARFGSVDCKAFRKAEPTLWARYRVDRDRGDMRLQPAAKELFGGAGEDNNDDNERS